MGISGRDADEEFRREARGVLRGAAEEVGWTPRPALGSGDGHDRPRRRELDRLLAQRGWGGIAWPREYGGRGEPLRRQAIFSEELAELGLATPYNRVGLGIVAPALLLHGTEEQKRRYLPPMQSCDEIWCQGFSEPEAGSDLAALRTSARRDGDTWVIDGHKVWTTLGADADVCLLLARTGDGPRHRAISALIVPMRQPEIEVRPIRQINGEEDFSEIRFNWATAPADAVVGTVNNGWAVSMDALAYERSLYMQQRQLRFAKLIRELEAGTDWAAAGDAAGDAFVDAEIAAQALAFAAKEQIAAMERGSRSGVAGNASKVLWSESYRRLAQLGTDLAYGGLTSGAREWQAEYYASLATSIYAGTNEIQRNLIAERGLGLPR